MYMPIWVLYWFPFFLMPNIAVKAGLFLLPLLICKVLMRNPKILTAGSIIRGWCFVMGSEMAGLFTFYVIEMKLGLTDYFYYSHYAQVSALALGISVSLNCLLNFFFSFKWNEVSAWQRALTSLFVAATTAPYLFLLDSGWPFLE